MNKKYYPSKAVQEAFQTLLLMTYAHRNGISDSTAFETWERLPDHVRSTALTEWDSQREAGRQDFEKVWLTEAFCRDHPEIVKMADSHWMERALLELKVMSLELAEQPVTPVPRAKPVKRKFTPVKSTRVRCVGKRGEKVTNSLVEQRARKAYDLRQRCFYAEQTGIPDPAAKRQWKNTPRYMKQEVVRLWGDVPQLVSQ